VTPANWRSRGSIRSAHHLREARVHLYFRICLRKLPALVTGNAWQVVDAETFLHGLDFPETLPERAALSTLMTSTVRYARSRFRWLAFCDGAAGGIRQAQAAWQRRAAFLRGDLAGARRTTGCLSRPTRAAGSSRGRPPPAVFGPAALARVLGAPATSVSEARTRRTNEQPTAVSSSLTRLNVAAQKIEG
jgi:hypothetical protein